MAELVQYYGTGRRKSSIARVFLRPGSGEFSVNKKKFEEYFVTAQQRAAAKRSLGIADIGETFDVVTTVSGGGVAAQADAVKNLPGSLEEVLLALERDHQFLYEGGVFTEDLVNTWIALKREREVDPVRLRPHPYEFMLYADS